LDEKGRLAIPAKYRALFSDGAVVTRSADPCLVIYPLAEWDTFAEKIASLPSSQIDVRQIARAIFSAAAEVELDRLGRINIPPVLRRYAELGGDVTLAGVGTQFEIWDRARWEGGQAGRSDIAGQLERFGI
jgi:MraZ protein